VIPLLGANVDIHPERVQAALYQAFDIQALYNDDLNQVTFFATITTSTPHAVAAILAATRPGQPSGPAASAPIYPLPQAPMRSQSTQIMEIPPARPFP
jgi:hypothetical protein